jgi:hypothetical protein
MLVHRYDEARRVAQRIDNPHPYLGPHLLLLNLSQHRDVARFRQEAEALIEALQPRGRFDGYLWASQLAVRDYSAAEATTLRLEQAYTPAPEPMDYLPDHLELRLVTLLITSDRQGLAATVADAERALGLAGTDTAERWDSVYAQSRVLLALARGDTPLVERELAALQYRVDDDIATEVGERRELCQYLALAGDAEAAVRCLRAGLTRPSRVMPFLDPLLPFYDRIRESPAFQALLAELVEEGWIAQSGSASRT